MQVAKQLGIQLHDSHFMMEAPIEDFGTYKVRRWPWETV